MPRVDDRLLNFVVRNGEIVDEETGSTWTIAGEGVRGPLDGHRLEVAIALDGFWLRHGRQLVFSTHDRRFAGLLERKLTPRELDERTLVLEFAGWDRSGPDLEWRYVEPQLEEGESRLLLSA